MCVPFTLLLFFISEMKKKKKRISAFNGGVAIFLGWSCNIPSLFMLQKLELRAGLMGPLARMQTLPSPYI